MPDDIPEVEIKDWPEFQSYYEEKFGKQWGRWVFRGQSDSTWGLAARIERELRSIPNSSGPKPDPVGIGGFAISGVRNRIELFFIKAFQSPAPILLRESLPEDTLTLLSLMQHWGYPTRLLDFSTSPYVGLHFALAPAFRGSIEASHAALYAVHLVPLRTIPSTHVLRKQGVISENQLDMNLEIDFSVTDKFKEYFFGTLGVRFVAPVHPRVVHERIVAQQGTFLCPSNIDHPFESNLLYPIRKERLPINGTVQKLVFPRNAAIDIFPRLVKMNIHEATVFPDLGGHARFVIDTVNIFKGLSDGTLLAALEGMERLNWLG